MSTTLSSLQELTSILNQMLGLDTPLRKRLVDIWKWHLDQRTQEMIMKWAKRLQQWAGEVLAANQEGRRVPMLPQEDEAIPHLPEGPTSPELVQVDEQLQRLPVHVQEKLIELAAKADAADLGVLVPELRNAALARELENWHMLQAPDGPTSQ